MVTQTIHVGDCELLEHYMDVTDADNPKWRNWDDREAARRDELERPIPQPVHGNSPAASECVNGWRGLSPLALNPLFGRRRRNGAG